MSQKNDRTKHKKTSDCLLETVQRVLCCFVVVWLDRFCGALPHAPQGSAAPLTPYQRREQRFRHRQRCRLDGRGCGFFGGLLRFCCFVVFLFGVGSDSGRAFAQSHPAIEAYSKGMQAYSEKRYDAALELFQSARILLPREEKWEPFRNGLRFYLGFCHYSIGGWEHWTQAKQLWESYVKSSVGRVESLEKTVKASVPRLEHLAHEQVLRMLGLAFEKERLLEMTRWLPRYKLVLGWKNQDVSKSSLYHLFEARSFRLEAKTAGGSSEKLLLYQNAKQLLQKIKKQELRIFWQKKAEEEEQVVRIESATLFMQRGIEAVREGAGEQALSFFREAEEEVKGMGKEVLEIQGELLYWRGRVFAQEKKPPSQKQAIVLLQRYLAHKSTKTAARQQSARTMLAALQLASKPRSRPKPLPKPISPLLVAGWVVAGVGVLAIGTGIGLGALGSKDFAESQGKVSAAEVTAVQISRPWMDGYHKVIAADILFGAGGLLVLLGGTTVVVLLLQQPRIPLKDKPFTAAQTQAVSCLSGCTDL